EIATVRLRSPLVGRAAELAALVEGLDAVARGEGRIALVTGDAGLGKSRLVAEAKRARSEAPVYALEGRALSIAQGISYGPFVETERLGICVASRPDHGEGAVARLRERARRDHAARFIEVRLTPLAGADSEQLARNLLSTSRIPSDVDAVVVEKAEGNPFFV